jgi:hypothetical protein
MVKCINQAQTLIEKLLRFRVAGGNRVMQVA